ncbi:MAG: nucleotide pyrophosphohydrolase [Epsilonproteobacteria bacterium]|nr:nucleotide pyrophosphohydrolase [Campylobacterota bacterium]
MEKFDQLKEKMLKFRQDRDWKQFHNPKDMALSLVLEAAEVLELFQWQREHELDAALKEKREQLGDELSDVLFWIVLMANDCDIDLFDAAERKLEKTAKKYPIEKARGVRKKYTEL